ncbi:MAG: D-alanine--D-alanine ligase [Spirochaetaceae bacterium]|nr:MAG: D-alanine--D-alanine ligase [Spirochaetaceae bacterium]
MGIRNVCILFGGRSGEHEVSCRSAASVAKNLDPNKYRQILIGIDKAGRWYLQHKAQFLKEDYGERLEVATMAEVVSVVPGQGLGSPSGSLNVDVVFPVLHGTFGEDGTVQGLLEIADLPYVGAGVLGSSLAMDKAKTKEIWRQSGLPVVDFIVVRDGSSESTARILKKIPVPLFVKPVTAGSSVGITKVKSADQLQPALAEALRFDSKVMVEPAVDAREIECAVLGNESPQAFAPGEILPNHEFYSYEAKYIDPEGAELKLPADLPETLSHEIRSLAVAAFRAAECSGMARVDFFLERESDRILLNEINTIPGFTNISMYPKMCEASGLAYPKLLDRLIELALERHNRRRALRFSL